MFKKSAIALLMFVFIGMLSACGEKTGEGEEGEAGFIGISMPTQSSERWIADGNNIKEQLEALGYRVTLQYAEDVIETQVSQIENMITQGVDILVIGSIDGESLSNVVDQAASDGIEVIAYDRLIMNTENISYYATFDNFQVGVIQGEYIVEALGLTSGEEGPFNIELFGGSPDDNNAYFFYDGAMSVLQPYIDEGKLVVRSEQVGMDRVSILRWDGAEAQKRMENLLSAHYTTERVDAILSPYDGISIGIISALRGVGYGTSEPWPVITGQDGEVASAKSIIAGEQTQTVFKDTRTLAAKTVEMINALLSGGEATVNNTDTYDNGVKVVPSYLIEPVSVDINNYQEVLIDSGYYSEDELD